MLFLQFYPYTAQEDTHTRVDTGACRSARTSKPVNCKITVTLQHHTNYKTPYDKKQSVYKESKYDIAGRTRKPKTTLWKKGSLRKHPFLLALCRWGRFAKRPQRRRARRSGCFRRLGKRERILPPAAIICDADNSGAEVHGN